MNQQAVIAVAVAPIHRDPNFSSEMITQSLMWENVYIRETKNNWHLIQTEDRYDGWIHAFYLSYCDVPISQNIVISRRIIPVFQDIEDLNSIISILSFGTSIPIASQSGRFSKISFPNGQNGYIENQKKMLDKSRNEIVKLSKILLGTPYLWGGRSSFGYDCSGFVQMVMKAIGISLQRDTKQQVLTAGLKEININDAKLGDLIFFSEKGCINHVAFNIGGGKIIHCSGQVKIESIKEGTPDFNKELSKFDITVMSIANFIPSNVSVSK